MIRNTDLVGAEMLGNKAGCALSRVLLPVRLFLNAPLRLALADGLGYYLIDLRVGPDLLATGKCEQRKCEHR